MSMQNKLNQSGRSMIEMLGVLAIVGVLSVGGISGYTRAMLKYRTNSATELLLTIAANVQNITMRTKKYDNLEAVALKLKAIPDKALDSDGNIGLNPFNGDIKLGSFQPTSSFYVAMNGLPKDACIAMASQNFGNSLIYAGSTAFDDNTLKSLKDIKFKTATPTCSANAPYYCLKQQMTPTTAANACSCIGTDSCSVALVMF